MELCSADMAPFFTYALLLIAGCSIHRDCLGVNIGDKRYGASLEAMDICDSKWLWDGKECVEIADGDIERDKIHV